jgi:hypothetical protein
VAATGSWPLIGIAEALPAAMLAPAIMASAAATILSLSISVPRCVLRRELAAHRKVAHLTCQKAEERI